MQPIREEEHKEHWPRESSKNPESHWIQDEEELQITQLGMEDEHRAHWLLWAAK